MKKYVQNLNISILFNPIIPLCRKCHCTQLASIAPFTRARCLPFYGKLFKVCLTVLTVSCVLPGVAAPALPPVEDSRGKFVKKQTF